MPLRDHFRPPVSSRHSWEGFHGGWPMTIVQKLFDQLPEGFTAEPRVHLGSYYEIDVGGFDHETPGSAPGGTSSDAEATAPALWSPPAPTATLDNDPTEPSEYEVLVYDENRARRLVAAVEIVSPANKDRAEHRRAFVTKCAALLQSDVCVSIVDLVTVRRANLYAELLEATGRTDPTLKPEPPELYALTCRRRPLGQRMQFQSWAYPLELGQPLPTLPLWLTEDLAIALDLEASYEETCRILRIS
jgi:hypothetical protein